MIQQNYFINAFPCSRGPLHWAVAGSPALPEVPDVPGNVSRDTGSFPAWNPAFQHSGTWGLKWNTQTGCDAAAEAWPQNKEADLAGCCPTAGPVPWQGSREQAAGAADRSGLSGGREGPAAWGAARCCHTSLLCGAAACSTCCSALPARCVHVSDLFCCQLKEVSQSSRQRVREARAGGALICPCLPLPSWDRGRNSRETANSPRGRAHLSTLLLLCPQ